MAKSQSRFARRHIRVLALSALVGLALVSCGTQTGAGSGTSGQAIEAAPFYAAPLEGSPEEAALALGRRSSYAAPIEGSPEQTAADLGR
jgi:outer membrane PBP1 activator LpoA protein